MAVVKQRVKFFKRISWSQFGIAEKADIQQDNCRISAEHILCIFIVNSLMVLYSFGDREVAKQAEL